MSKLDALFEELVTANRILATEGVVDSFGHVSARHPENPQRFFLSRARAPDCIKKDDIMEFTLEGEPINPGGKAPYLERFIHGAVYEARPDVMAVVHAHAEDVLPFGITAAPLRPVIHSGSFMGETVPVWDIRERFGDTNLLVTNMPQGRDLAASLAANNVALMRGHGFVAAARSVIEVVRMSVFVPRNARVQLAAMQLGDFKPLSRGEIAARNAGYKPHSPETWRAWEYWATRAGCRELL